MAAGRKRTFKEEEALTKAMHEFWKNGYSGTSMLDLTRAMSINKPSIYGTFGNKEQLFIKAIKNYVEKFGIPHFNKLLETNLSTRTRVENYLLSIVDMLIKEDLPSGCFVASSTVEAGGECLPDRVLEIISSINKQTQIALCEFFQNEINQAHIPKHHSAKELAEYILTVQLGLAVMARSSTDHKTLGAIAKNATKILA